MKLEEWPGKAMGRQDSVDSLRYCTLSTPEFERLEIKQL